MAEKLESIDNYTKNPYWHKDMLNKIKALYGLKYPDAEKPIEESDLYQDPNNIINEFDLYVPIEHMQSRMINKRKKQFERVKKALNDLELENEEDMSPIDAYYKTMGFDSDDAAKDISKALRYLLDSADVSNLLGSSDNNLYTRNVLHSKKQDLASLLDKARDAKIKQYEDYIKEDPNYLEWDEDKAKVKRDKELSDAQAMRSLKLLSQEHPDWVDRWYRRNRQYISGVDQQGNVLFKDLPSAYSELGSHLNHLARKGDILKDGRDWMIPAGVMKQINPEYKRWYDLWKQFYKMTPGAVQRYNEMGSGISEEDQQNKPRYVHHHRLQGEWHKAHREMPRELSELLSISGLQRILQTANKQGDNNNLDIIVSKLSEFIEDAYRNERRNNKLADRFRVDSINDVDKIQQTYRDYRKLIGDYEDLSKYLQENKYTWAQDDSTDYDPDTGDEIEKESLDEDRRIRDLIASGEVKSLDDLLKLPNIPRLMEDDPDQYYGSSGYRYGLGDEPFYLEQNDIIKAREWKQNQKSKFTTPYMYGKDIKKAIKGTGWRLMSKYQDQVDITDRDIICVGAEPGGRFGNHDYGKDYRDAINNKKALILAPEDSDIHVTADIRFDTDENGVIEQAYVKQLRGPNNHPYERDDEGYEDYQEWVKQGRFQDLYEIADRLVGMNVNQPEQEPWDDEPTKEDSIEEDKDIDVSDFIMKEIKKRKPLWKIVNENELCDYALKDIEYTDEEGLLNKALTDMPRWVA